MFPASLSYPNELVDHESIQTFTKLQQIATAPYCAGGLSTPRFVLPPPPKQKHLPWQIIEILLNTFSYALKLFQGTLWQNFAQSTCRSRISPRRDSSIWRSEASSPRYLPNDCTREWHRAVLCKYIRMYDNLNDHISDLASPFL